MSVPAVRRGWQGYGEADRDVVSVPGVWRGKQGCGAVNSHVASEDEKINK